MSLSSCRACDGLIPAGRATCPHCDRPFGRVGRVGRIWPKVAKVATAGAALMTLMACYGMIGRPMGPGVDDRDGDGAATDCDDTRADIFPGAADRFGDGVDQNCDGADGWADPAAPPPPPAPAAVATDPVAAPPDPAVPVKAIAVDPPAP